MKKKGNFTLSVELIKELENLSKKTLIKKSVLIEQGFWLLKKKYDKEK